MQVYFVSLLYNVLFSGFCIMNVWFLNCSSEYLNTTPTTISMISLVNMVVQPSCMWETFLRILRNKILRLLFADTGGEQMGSELKLSIFVLGVGPGCLGFHLFSENNELLYTIYSP